MNNLPYVYTMEELEALIAQWGFLPFFRNRINGFSIEDVMDENRIFNETRDCAWNWKGPIISHWECAYGKFFGGKAGYVHLSWLPDLMNWRRSVHPLESYPEEARHILDVLRENESMLSRSLKRASGFTLARRKRRFADPDDPTKVIREKRTGADFDSLINKLQIGTYVCIADFEPAPGRSGEYGWALSVYSTPEAMYDFSPDSLSAPPAAFGFDDGPDAFDPEEFIRDTRGPVSTEGRGNESPGANWLEAVQGRSPQQSRQRILGHLRSIFPDAPAKVWDSLI